MRYNKLRKKMKSRWSIKYKKSINCNHPKGFSQKNYCKRKKRGGKYLENFSSWLSFNENVEQNIDIWLQSIQDYAKPQEKQILHNIGVYQSREEFRADTGRDPNSWDLRNPPSGNIVLEFNDRLKIYKQRIINVLKRKNIENLNWLSFSVGYLAAKYFYEEDLDLAIEVTRQRISNGELPKTEIGIKGWIQIGFESSGFVQEHLRQQQELSNRKKLKLKKSGETLEEDENLVKLIGEQDNLKLYFLPLVTSNVGYAGNVISDSDDIKKKMEIRKRLLCKYGKGTNWCTANPSGDYDEYYVDQDIYILHENNTPKYQFTGCSRHFSDQFMDVKDRRVTEISFKEMNFLIEYTDLNCHNLKVAFDNLQQYLADRSIDKYTFRQNSLSFGSIINIIKDKELINFPIKQTEEFIFKIEISDFEIKQVITLVSIIPSKLLDLFSDGQIFDVIEKLQYGGYEELKEKLSKERFERFLNNYRNDLFDDEKNPQYAMEMVKSRKNTIRKSLNSTSNDENLFNLLNFIVEKTNIGSQEAYTIFDTVLGFQAKRYRENIISTPTLNANIKKFAKIFGTENINKIDLERFQSRMGIKLVPDGDKFKLKINLDKMTWGSAKLMTQFLLDYNENISGTTD